MTFSQEVARFADKFDDRAQLLVERCVDAVFESVVNGSPVTAAPGQPVSGDRRGYELKDSFFRKRVGEFEWVVGTNLFYGPWIEEGMLPEGKRLVHRSAVGGNHSVKMTEAAWPWLVDDVVSKMAAQ